MANVQTYRKGLFLFDMHVPDHNKSVLKIVKEFKDDFKPDIVVAGGDWMSVDQVDAFNNESEISLLDEFNIVNEYMDAFGVTDFFEGNHEERLRRIGLTDKRLRSLLDLERNLDLKKKNINLYPYHNKKGIMKIGKLSVLHGFFANKYVAAKTADAYGCCVFGHAHRFQTFQPKISSKWATGWSIGCLCNTDLEYQQTNGPNGWLNGFAYGYFYKNGDFSIYPVRIVGKRVVINDKEYVK